MAKTVVYIRIHVNGDMQRLIRRKQQRS